MDIAITFSSPWTVIDYLTKKKPFQERVLIQMNQFVALLALKGMISASKRHKCICIVGMVIKNLKARRHFSYDLDSQKLSY